MELRIEGRGGGARGCAHGSRCGNPLDRVLLDEGQQCGIGGMAGNCRSQDIQCLMRLPFPVQGHRQQFACPGIFLIQPQHVAEVHLRLAVVALRVVHGAHQQLRRLAIGQHFQHLLKLRYRVIEMSLFVIRHGMQIMGIGLAGCHLLQRVDMAQCAVDLILLNLGIRQPRHDKELLLRQ